VEERLASRPQLGGLLPDQVEDDGEIVDAERPERVLVLADLAEVLAIAVDVEDLTELSGVDQALQLLDGGVVQQEVTGEENEITFLGQCDELVRLGAA
jgi:hypothetical protein